MSKAADYWMDNIVNPRCDECGVRVPSVLPQLCPECADRMRRASRRAMLEWLSQERPDRRVHIVKLPDGMK